MHLVPFPLLALIPLFPLLGAAYCGLVGCRLFKKYGEGAIHLPAILLPWGSFAVTLVAVFTLAGAGHGAVLHQRLWDWFRIGSLSVDAAFQIDRLSAVMCLVVTFVGSLIHVYSRGYMKGDASYWRFFSNLNLFMFSMLVLVLGDNLLVMFVGWEGVGLCSYLLIGFWYRERKNAVAGMKAFVVNRIGDYGFTLGIFLLFWGLAAAPAGLLLGQMGETDAAASAHEVASGHDGKAAAGEETARNAWAALPTHGDVLAPGREHDAPAGEPGAAGEAGATHDAEAGPTPLTSVAFRDIERIMEDPARRAAVLNQKVLGLGLITLVCLLFFVGATGKSAQLPLYVWLPDAMAGPTPVSALIHAATMVTAGVYMVARLHFLFACSPVAMTVVATVGALTALFAATIGLFQYDIKKVLAYSTVSQLGFMFVAVGVGAYWVGIFHLVTHAFFKACLFLGSGSVILGCHHEQDMRKMGGLRKLMPITAVTYFLSACAIAGFPFFSGFFSKDEILWKAFDSGNMLLPSGGMILWVLAATAALCTSFYMFRSYYMTFSGAYRGAQGDGVHRAHAVKDAHGSHASASAHAASDAHAVMDAAHESHEGHGHGLPKESPRSMTWVLAVLGFLAVVGGYIGLPILWGLPNAFEAWLEPMFEGSHHLIRSAERGHAAEWGLMLFSVVIAFSGFFLARWLYKDAKNPIPGRLLASRSGLVQGFHRVVYNKYYVDEAYQASFVNGTMGLSRLSSWFDRTIIDGIVNLAGTVGKLVSSVQGWIDARVVDGTVNLVGSLSMRAGRSLRRVQTGRIQNYVFGLTAGAVVLVVIGFLLRW